MSDTLTAPTAGGASPAPAPPDAAPSDAPPAADVAPAADSAAKGSAPASVDAPAPPDVGDASSDGQSPDDQAPLRMSLLKSMLIQRRFEEKCAEAYALGKIGGFCHLYIGQEAILTGVMSMIRPDDYIITA